LADAQTLANLAEVGVEGEDVEAFDGVSEDDVDSVVGEAGFGADIGNRTFEGGIDGVVGLAVGIAAQAADIDAFVHLMPFGADATELAAGPGFTCGADEEGGFAALGEDGPVRGGELEGRGGGLRGGAPSP